jgi:hypothetical protein
MSQRKVVKFVSGQAVSDGAGVRLKRVIGTPQLDQVESVPHAGRVQVGPRRRLLADSPTTRIAASRP